MSQLIINKLSQKELIEFLGKCWMTHDGMWFYSTFMENGIESANRINKAAIKSLAPIEIHRLKKLMGIDFILSYEELKKFFMGASELLIPDFMNISFKFPGNNTATWEFNEKNCFAYNDIKALGVIDQYECGPLYRIRNWLDTLGIKHEIEPSLDKCVMPSKGECSGKIVFKF
jgi:hypothetical protein